MNIGGNERLNLDHVYEMRILNNRGLRKRDHTDHGSRTKDHMDHGSRTKDHMDHGIRKGIIRITDRGQKIIWITGFIRITDRGTHGSGILGPRPRLL